MLNAVGNSTMLWLVRFEYRRHRQCKPIGICGYSSWKIFHGASFKENQDLTFACYLQNIRCCNQHGSLGIKHDRNTSQE